MAMFEGDELVDVDVGGRVMKVPASVASQLALGNGAGPGGGPRIAPAPVPIVAPTNELPVAAPTAPNSVVAPINNPVFDPETNTPTADQPQRNPYEEAPAQPTPPVEQKAGTGPSAYKEMKGRANAQVKAEKASAKPAKGAPAPGAPKLGDYASGYADQDAALRAQQAAGLNTADIEAMGQQAVAEVLADRNKQFDTLFAQREAQARADLEAIQKRNIAYDAAIKKFADTKIDRTVDHPIMAAVSMALGGLGMAMMGRGAEENPAIKALYTAIDRKVAGQMQDLEKQGKVLGLEKDAIAGMRTQASDNLALQNLLIAGQTEKAARYMEEIAARTSVDTIKSRALEGAAALRARAADFKMAAIDKQTDSDHKDKDRAERDMANRRTVGATYAGIAENRRQFDLDLKFKKEKLDGDLAIATMQANKAGKTEQAKLFATAAKENNERGVGDANGNYLLQPDGKKAFEEADKLEKQAAALEKKNPAAAQQYREKASQIRAEVLADENKGVWRVGSAPDAAKMADGIAEGRNVAKLANEIKQLAATQGKDWVKTDVGRAAIQAKMTELTMHLKNAWGLGVLSKQDVALVNQGTGGDPTQMTKEQLAYELTNGLIGDDPDNYGSRLDSLAADVKNGITLKARHNKFRGDVKDIFGDEEKFNTESDAGKDYAAIYNDKSIDEQEAGAARDPYRDAEQGKSFSTNSVKENFKDTGRAMKGVLQKGFAGGTERDKIEENADGAVTKDAGAAIDRLIVRARGNGPDAQEARDLLLKGAANTDKPAQAGAIRNRLMRQAPDLFKKTEQGQADAKFAKGPGVPMVGGVAVPLETLAGHATIDQASFDQLTKQAATDPYAQKLLKSVIDYRAKQQGIQGPH